MYLPLSPHQHSERCQRKKTQGLSKSPKTQRSNSKAPVSSLQRSRVKSSRGHSQAGPLPSCAHRCPEGGCGSHSFILSSADASQRQPTLFFLPVALTPPSRLVLSPQPQEWLQELRVVKEIGTTSSKAKTKKLLTLDSGACGGSVSFYRFKGPARGYVAVSL